MKIAFLPIDNRPVCYTLPIQIASIDNDIEFFVPDRKYLGNLKNSADIGNLFEWLKSLPQNLDGIILSLDTIAYGGLIPSRRSSESFEQIKSRLNVLKNILIEKKSKIYAFSSIMRISNNNINQEEKEYWSQYGKKIFEYSYNFHKNNTKKTDIPDDILKDYISTRKRNFEINKIYLSWQKEGIFDTLIFSKDDCSEYGLNIMEAKELEQMGAYVKTGADEIPLSLLSRAIKGDVKICPIFLEDNYKTLLSNYEDISIEDCVKNQIELAGCKMVSQADADIILYVNNFIDKQGEIVMKVSTSSYHGKFNVIDNKKYMIADVRFANGSDNNFVEELFKNDIEDEFFYGYSGWNTSANTLGSLICGAKVKFLAKEYAQDEFKKLQLTRFMDDWGYQANVRQRLLSTNEEILKEKMEFYEKKLYDVYEYEGKMSYSFPWNRLFEVEIEFN